MDVPGVDGVQCFDDASNRRYHRVIASLDIVVKDNTVKVVDVIGELSAFFGGGGALAEKLRTYLCCQFGIH